MATGDAIASFNPIYAQGMTVAALQAQALGRVLDRHANIRASTVRAYFRAAAAVIATPWQISAGADFLYPQTTGPKPPGVDALNRYITSVQRAAQVDDQVRRAFLRVQHLLAPPVTLLTPAMIFRVLRASHGLGRSSGR